MNFFEALESRWRGRKERKFLAEYGCDTWEQYHRRYDPDYSYMANRIKSIYHGYLHVAVPDSVRYRWEEYPKMEEWCNQRCLGKWRSDIHRVIRDSLTGEWELNGIGGGDHMFFAFKDERDYLMFTLRWS